MTTFIEARLKKSYGLINIDKYRVAAHRIIQFTLFDLNKEMLIVLELFFPKNYHYKKNGNGAII